VRELAGEGVRVRRLRSRRRGGRGRRLGEVHGGAGWSGLIWWLSWKGVIVLGFGGEMIKGVPSPSSWGVRTREEGGCSTRACGRQVYGGRARGRDGSAVVWSKLVAVRARASSLLHGMTKLVVVVWRRHRNRAMRSSLHCTSVLSEPLRQTHE
jgi:hypothetical protein